MQIDAQTIRPPMSIVNTDLLYSQEGMTVLRVGRGETSLVYSELLARSAIFARGTSESVRPLLAYLFRLLCLPCLLHVPREIFFAQSDW